MGLVIFNVLLTIWVVIDALRRKAGVAKWGIGTLLVAPIVAPLYFAKRPLKAGEERHGGTAWNFLKNFSLAWTLHMAIWAGHYFIFVGNKLSETSSSAGKLGAAIGGTLGMTFLAMAWFFPMFGAVVLGFFLRKSSVVEKGPTGLLA